MHVSKMRIKVYHVEIKWTYGLIMYMATHLGNAAFPFRIAVSSECGVS